MAGDYIMLTLRSIEHVGSNGYRALDNLTPAHGKQHCQNSAENLCVMCVFIEAQSQSSVKVQGKLRTTE